jgi:hypothetical protein
MGRPHPYPCRGFASIEAEVVVDLNVPGRPLAAASEMVYDNAGAAFKIPV